MPDNERDRIIDQVAHVLIDVATTEDVTADAACDMARALDHEGLLRSRGDTDEDAKLRAERDHWEHHAWEAGEGFKRAIADAARAGARRRAMEAELDRAVAETAALRDAVRALHQPHVCTGYPDCNPLFGGGCAHAGDCRECRREHPCPTIRALDGEVS